MSKRALIVASMLLMLMAPFAEAKHKNSKIPKSAKHSRITGPKHFKFKQGKVQKRNKHGR